MERFLDPHPLHFTHADVVIATVIEASSFSVRVSGHSLRDFQLAAVRQVVSDPGGAEGVAADRGFKLGVCRAATYHVPDIRPAEGPIGELARAPDRGPEERSLAVAIYASRHNVGVHVSFDLVGVTTPNVKNRTLTPKAEHSELPTSAFLYQSVRSVRFATLMLVHTDRQNFRVSDTLSSAVLRQLVESGFATIPGPYTRDSFKHVATAYDEVMASGSGSDFKVASTTTRMSDLLNHSSAFDDVFLFPPLLEAASHFVGKVFKLSSFLGRTLRSGVAAQELHADLPRDSNDGPLLGFILMIDSFRDENGATRFVPGSQLWADLPTDRLSDARTTFPGEMVVCGEAGSLILFDGAIWHGHTANLTAHPRRSIQGYFVRQDAHSGFDFRNRLTSPTRTRMSPIARRLLSLDDQCQLRSTDKSW